MTKRTELKQLTAEFAKLKTPELVEEFLLGLLTPAELEEIPQRLQIVKLLKQGVAQHEIAKRLGVGIATVTRGARELKLGRFANVDPWA
jgi:TrpR family trp operon transcriptional repressor